MTAGRRSDGSVARPRPLLSVAEAGRALGIRTTAAYEWARRGELPGLVKLGGRLYVRAAVLDRFIAGEDMPPTPTHDLATIHVARSGYGE